MRSVELPARGHFRIRKRKKMNPRIEISAEKKLAGKRLTMRFADRSHRQYANHFNSYQLHFKYERYYFHQLNSGKPTVIPFTKSKRKNYATIPNALDTNQFLPFNSQPKQILIFINDRHHLQHLVNLNSVRSSTGIFSFLLPVFKT